jgi:hypothetical protein
MNSTGDWGALGAVFGHEMGASDESGEDMFELVASGASNALESLPSPTQTTASCSGSASSTATPTACVCVSTCARKPCPCRSANNVCTAACKCGKKKACVNKVYSINCTYRAYHFDVHWLLHAVPYFRASHIFVPHAQVVNTLSYSTSLQ